MEHHEEDDDQHKGGMKKPLLSKPSNTTLGGFRTVPFILAHEGFERAAFYGLQPNMIIYLMGAYGLDMATGSNIIFLWGAAMNFTPIIGAILADSCVSRFRLIGFGSISSVLGMMVLWSTTIIPGVRPTYDETTLKSSTSATPFHLIYLCSAFGLMSLGAGGIRSSTLAFGADQLRAVGDEEDAKKDTNGALQSLFNWYYMAVSISLLFAQTCIVYIQDRMGWQVGFAVPVSLMLLSAFSFFLASSFYVKLKPTASVFTRFAQVIVAAWKNRHCELSSSVSLYFGEEGSIFKAPTEKLRFLNKACIIKDPRQGLNLDEMAIVDQWRLCTVDQVEEFKSVIKVIPIWSTGIILCVASWQASFTVVQAKSMDLHFFNTSFQIPPGSFGTFALISVIIWLVLYNHVIVPLASKAFAKPVSIGVKTRMGIGVLLSFLCMVVAGVVENVRRGRALANTPMSALWLVPQVCLLGLSEAFTAIAQIEFFYSMLPESMSSISTNLHGLGAGVSSLVSSVILSVINHVTSKSGKTSWVASDPNKGHYDYYYWVLAGLCLLNFVYYLVCCRGYTKGKSDTPGEGENVS